MRFLREQGIGAGALTRLSALHPAVDRTVRAARRDLYLRKLFRDGPARRGSPTGRKFVILNHCYDLDIEAYRAADTAHTLWVLDPFSVFTDVFHYFPPEHRDLASVYGDGAMHETIRRYKTAFVDKFVERLIRETSLDALITPSDTFYYLRPVIEELRARGIPTIVQDKEGTIAPGAIMDDHGRILTERYPPIADQFYFWSDSHLDFWRHVGVDLARTRVLGQPRSDFFFHPDRWPTKDALGLSKHKKLVVLFTYDADSYARGAEPNPERPWRSQRWDTHEAVRALARERPDVEVIIKAHPQQAELAEVVAECADHALPNVQLMTGAARASHLMVLADVIVGFQSTAMIEAMLTDKPVIYAGWGEPHVKYDVGLIPIHRSEGCIVASGRANLDELLRRALDGQLRPSPTMRQSRKQFTDRYFFEADGHCAERVLNAAASYLAEQRC